MTADGLRIGLVGCGRMGLIRARAVKASGSMPAVFCDVDIRRARQLASLVQPDGLVVDDWRGIDLSTVDAVILCTPPSTRGPLEQAAIEQGVPVFVEKPVALSSEQWVLVLRALDARPGITAVGYMNRYRRSVADAVDRLKGRPILGIAACWAAPPYSVPWWTDADVSGGPLNDYATHLIDLARYFAGNVKSVHAVADVVRDSPRERGETGVVGMRFECGAVGSVIYSSSAKAKSVAFDVIHDEGTLRLVGWDLRLWPETRRDPAAGNQDRDTVFFEETKAFLTAVSAGSPGEIRSDFRDALRTQQVVDAVRRALSTGNVEDVCWHPHATRGTA